MSRQIKTILVGLLVLLVISIIMNLMLCFGSTGAVISNADSIVQEKDCIIQQRNDSITKIVQDIKAIGDCAKEISSDRLSPVDEINKIVKKYN